MRYALLNFILSETMTFVTGILNPHKPMKE